MLFTPYLIQQVVDVFPVLTGEEKQQVEVHLRSTRYNVNWRENRSSLKNAVIYNLLQLWQAIFHPGSRRFLFNPLGFNQAEVVWQFTASSPAANSTGWSCLPIQFMKEKVTLELRNSRGIINFLTKYSYIYQFLI